MPTSCRQHRLDPASLFDKTVTQSPQHKERRGAAFPAPRAAFRSMAELPADVTVKAEEAPPAAPASYDGPGPLNEPPETVAQAAPPPPPADEQTPQVAQQTPVAMTPEQAAAAAA